MDLALILTTEARKVEEGQEVCFDITIYNQGSQTIKEANVVDYIPKGLELISEGWTEVATATVSKNILFQNGLNPGESQIETICFKVGNLKDIYTIENVAEINGSEDICNNDVSSKDIDSKADHNKNNDDHHPVIFLIQQFGSFDIRL